MSKEVEEEEEPKNLFNSEPSPQNKSCSECQQDVRIKYFGMSICQYVSMSVCQYVRMQLFSLGIKMKVVQNVIRTSDSHYITWTEDPICTVGFTFSD